MKSLFIHCRNQLAACNVHDLGFSRLYLKKKGFDSVSVVQDYLEINESLTKTTSGYCESKNLYKGISQTFFRLLLQMYAAWHMKR